MWKKAFGCSSKRKVQKELNVKKCQGSQRSKTTNIRREIKDEKIGKDIFPCCLVILLRYIFCLLIFLIHFLLFLPIPYRCFFLEALICTDSLTMPLPLCFPPTPAHKHDKRKDLSPLPLPSMSFCQLMNHCQVHDTKTEQLIFKVKTSF